MGEQAPATEKEVKQGAPRAQHPQDRGCCWLRFSTKDLQPMAGPGPGRSSFGRNLKLFGIEGKKGLANSRRAGRAAERSWWRALMRLASLENGGSVSCLHGTGRCLAFSWSQCCHDPLQTGAAQGLR